MLYYLSIHFFFYAPPPDPLVAPPAPPPDPLAPPAPPAAPPAPGFSFFFLFSYTAYLILSYLNAF